jgi:hypothetical protein
LLRRAIDAIRKCAAGAIGADTVRPAVVLVNQRRPWALNDFLIFGEFVRIRPVL